MPATRDELLEALTKSYHDVLPLLDYLKARLKYDTVRWLRQYGSKDDIVFTTRIKSFDRVYDKLVRKAHPLTEDSTVLNIALTQRGVLDDLIGIRFVCFDPFNVYTLIQYFLITERVATSQRSYYVSPKTNLQDPLFSFLDTHSFKREHKSGRDYEDVNFIMRFSHPIDKYFGSGREQFLSLAQRAQPGSLDEKFTALNALFNKLNNDHPELIEAIRRFPIECQIVTATQHIYNKTQRPHYEYVLQAKGDEPTLAAAEVKDLSSRLDLLKLTLLASDQNMHSIHEKFGIQYQPPLKIDPGTSFSLEERLPADILGQNARLEEINASLLPEIIRPHANSFERQAVLNHFFEKIDLINQSIAERARTHGDISDQKLLTVTDLPALGFPEILFWSYQRIILLALSVMLVYAPDDDVRKRIVSVLRFGNEFEAANQKISDVDIVLGRFFEKLEAIDNAIDLKLQAGPSKIDGWQEGVLTASIFLDPIVQWRYASYLYRKRQYKSAFQETRVAIPIYDRLAGQEDSKRSLPEKAQFIRRGVEYELCDEVLSLRFSTTSVAGMLELCNVIVARDDEWKEQLDKVIAQSKLLTERARALSFQILFRMCAVSAGGLAGEGLEVLRREFATPFSDLETEISIATPDEVTDKTWWLLAKSVMLESASDKCLEQYRVRSKRMSHHTVERQRFESVCADLVDLWAPEGNTVKSRSEFVANILGRLKKEAKSLASSAALNEPVTETAKALVVLSAEIRNMLTTSGKTAPREEIGRRIAGCVSDAAAEHILIDTVVAGLRSILNI